MTNPAQLIRINLCADSVFFLNRFIDHFEKDMVPLPEIRVNLVEPKALLS